MAKCEDEVCCQEIFVGDEGLPIQFHVHTCDTTVEPRVESVLDISNPVALDLKFLKPDGTYTTNLVAALVTDGTDGLAEYITLSDTLDIDGSWKGQLEVELASGRKSTTVISFKVLPKL